MSRSIAEITSCYLGNVGSESSKAIGNAGKDSFSQVFQKTNETKTTVTDSPRASKTEGDSVQNHANIQKKNGPDQLQKKQQEADKTVEEERLLTAAEKAGAQMIQEVADTFRVTVEEVQQVMEELGLTPLDLLDGEKLTQLVLGLHPEADSMTIVTDEQLFADLKGLMATAENLLNQLAEEAQMPKEELAKMLTLIREQEGGAAESPLVQEKPMDEPQDTMKLTETVEPRVEVETELVPMAKTLSGEGQELQTAETVTKAPDTQSERSQNKPEGGSTDNNRQQAGESFTTNLLNQLSEAVEEAGKSEGSYGVSGQDIINQITEQIKVSIKADTTEMELQLNPASLGSLKVQIASKAGVLTATFITQNEAVKAALEGQMVQLKENFEQQGLKVEAVEVNVEARGFERSLDQQDREQSSFQEQTKKNGRRINLLGSEGSEEDLLSEDLSEEDRIVADMMLRNGNTVDYTA